MYRQFYKKYKFYIKRVTGHSFPNISRVMVNENSFYIQSMKNDNESNTVYTASRYLLSPFSITKTKYLNQHTIQSHF